MKISFSLPSKATARSLPTKSEDADDEEKLEYLNEFDPTQPASKKLKVIPKLENSWRPESKMKNIKMGDSELKFEAEVQPAGMEAEVDYGLNLRSSRASESTEIGKSGQNDGEEAFAEAELRKLKEDIEELPDEASLDAYESLPVEDFGAALLRGMGWSEGKGIGRAKDPVAPVEYVRRVGREGLGATPAPPVEKPKKYLKPGETRDSRKDLVAASGPDGRIRNVVELGEKLVERRRKGVAVGKIMRIVDGRHAGLRGEIMEILQNDVVIRLVKSDESVVVSMGEVADVGSVEEDLCLKRLRVMRLRGDARGAEKEGTGDGRDSYGGEKRSDYGATDEKKPDHSRRNEKYRDNSGRDVSRDLGNRVDKKTDCTTKNEGGADYRSRDEIRESGSRYERGPDYNSRYENRDHSRGYDRKADSRSRGDRRGEEDTEIHRKQLEIQRDKGDRSDSGRDYRKAGSRSRGDRRGEEDTEIDRKQLEVQRDKEDRSDSGRDYRKKGYDKQEEYGRKERSTRREGREEESGRMRESRDRGNGRRGQSESKKQQRVEEDRRNTEVDVRKDEKRSESKNELKERILETTWLVSHIRVRVISKGFKEGRLYLKKGRVLDVVDPTSCDLLMDENGEVVQGVRQDILETALPKRGGLILVVEGKHKGVLGKLLEKNSEKEVGLVQKEDTHEILTLRLDHIAEFIGDSIDIGY